MIGASAPGRVHLLGEHTEHADGLVLSTPIAARAHVELRRRRDDRVSVWSRELGARAEYRLGAERRQGGWLDLVQGCTLALREAGHAHGGAEITIASDVPLGRGLASSAAVAVAVLRALRAAFALPLDEDAIARLGQRAEASFLGAPAGAIDPRVASLGAAGQVLLIDSRTLASRSLVLSPVDLIVIAAGPRPDPGAVASRTRRLECERAAALLGVAALRDVPVTGLDRVAALPPPLDRRARHVVAETARVLAAVHALEVGDLGALGALVRASHVSLRDDYEVSLPALDALVTITAQDPDVLGARLTGGGFGGSFGGAIVVLARAGTGPVVAKRTTGRYLVQTSHAAEVLVAGDPRGHAR